MQHMNSKKMRECADTCQECRVVCLETVSYCLEKGGKHAAAAHIRLLLDCAEICSASAGFLVRGSELHGRTCGVCADVCEACARSCEAMGDDAQMKRCAEVCRRCAQSCRSMATAAA